MVAKGYIYHHYREYATDKGDYILSESKFWSAVKEEIKEIELGIKGEQVRYFQAGLGTRPRFIEKIFCKSGEISTFPIGKGDLVIEAKDINLNIITKHKIITREED
jgi:hypothetical protein